jgi:hypothetical protein
MRFLSPAEIRVVRTLLIDEYATDQEGEHSARVPRSTFQSIRRRALVSGWLKERYIPYPASIGFSSVVIRLAQPFAERWGEALQILRTETTVLLWASSETLFSVEFGRGDLPRKTLDLPSKVFRQTWSIEARIERGEIPVYFDFEGVWSRWALQSEPVAYPRAFTGRPKAQSNQSIRELRYRAEDLQSLVVRPFEFGSLPPARLSLSQARLPRRLRRLVEAGVAFRRMIPDLSEMPPVQDNRMEQVVFVTGRLRDGGNAEALRQELARESKSVPFIFASDSDRVLFAGLAPAPRSATSGRTPMMDILGRHVQGIEVIRDKIESLVAVVDHRYDRLLPSVGTA